MKPVFDLSVPESSYLFGLLQTDGHLDQRTRSRGRLSIELSEKDKDVLDRLQRLVPVYSSVGTRVRDTPFKKGYRSAIWCLYDREVREALNSLGLPYGRKSNIVAPPDVPFSSRDYYRGLVDGDGSLGLTGEGFPFFSFTTSSRSLAQSYLTFLGSLTGKVKYAHPNTRDAMYNICVFKEDAQIVAGALYYEGCLALNRKVCLAQEILAWIRPPEMRKRTWNVKRWSAEEDDVVRQHSVTTAAEMLGRTEKSVRIRASRLRQAQVGPHPILGADCLTTSIWPGCAYTRLESSGSHDLGGVDAAGA